MGLTLTSYVQRLGHALPYFAPRSGVFCPAGAGWSGNGLQRSEGQSSVSLEQQDDVHETSDVGGVYLVTQIVKLLSISLEGMRGAEQVRTRHRSIKQGFLPLVSQQAVKLGIFFTNALRLHYIQSSTSVKKGIQGVIQYLSRCSCYLCCKERM